MPTARVPVIDLAAPRADALVQIDRACAEWGFFQVIGHGVPRSLCDALVAETRAFFALPPAQKRAIERTATNAWGFYDRELTKNRLDLKEIYDVGPEIARGPLAGNTPQWPVALPRFRPVVERFYAACESIARELLACVAENLGTPPERLAADFGEHHTSFLRLNHYPRCSDPAPADADLFPREGRLGIHHHTDSGALTVLLQDDHPGLQVYRDGTWHLVEPRPEALVVNLGDIVQVWSNDRYRAALHRVLASDRHERVSAPFFFNPSSDAVYAPLPESCDAAHPPRYRPIRWGEFRAARAAGDYADVGEEIQISHYRIG